ncbi:MAG TPA: type II secretion system protein, partial [Candidatus Methanoperedens sp.]|nr:type II secretion system protein [Candidatus Methanoperedens sp.]
MINKRAFTLFELLVSISIIGILVAVASTAYGSTQRKARDSRRMEDMNVIQKAAEIYYSSHSYNYPPAEADFVSSGVLQQWPVDPKGAGTSFPYAYNPVATGYCACAL